jgi:hypothetical protein
MNITLTLTFSTIKVRPDLRHKRDALSPRKKARRWNCAQSTTKHRVGISEIENNTSTASKKTHPFYSPGEQHLHISLSAALAVGACHANL